MRPRWPDHPHPRSRILRHDPRTIPQTPAACDIPVREAPGVARTGPSTTPRTGHRHDITREMLVLEVGVRTPRKEAVSSEAAPQMPDPSFRYLIRHLRVLRLQQDNHTLHVLPILAKSAGKERHPGLPSLRRDASVLSDKRDGAEGLNGGGAAEFGHLHGLEGEASPAAVPQRLFRLVMVECQGFGHGLAFDDVVDLLRGVPARGVVSEVVDAHLDGFG